VAILGTLESCIAAPLLVEQNRRLIETLLQILFAVLQRFHASLQEKIALFEARRGSI
jgi:hypothetical protein